MDALIDYLESLPPLNLIGYCPITYRDVMRRACSNLGRTMTDEEIDEAFEEYARDYREFERRSAWDA